MNELYATTLLALNACLSPTTTKENRTSAEGFLTQLKQSNECVQILNIILTEQSLEHSDPVRLLTLSVLQDWINVWWNRLAQPDQDVMRSKVIDLVNKSIGYSTIRGIRTKLAVILASIAERQYPQHWPSFLTDVIGIWISSPERQHLIILTLDYLLSDCTNSDFSNLLPSVRKSDILTAVRVDLKRLLTTAHGFCEHCLSTFQASQEASQKSQTAELLNATLRMLQSVMIVAKPAEVLIPPHDLAVLAISLLSVPDVQVEAVNLLQSISLHKLPLEIFARVIEHVVKKRVTHLPEDDEDSLAFQRTYAETIYVILSLNVKEAMSAELISLPRGQEVLNKYFTVMAELLDQPSKRLVSDVAKDWIKIFKDDASMNLVWMQEVCGVVLRSYAGRSMRVEWMRDAAGTPSEPVDHIAALEFDDYDDWVDFQQTYLNQMRQLASVCGEKFPAVSCSFMHQQLQWLIANHGSMTATTTAVDSTGHTTINSNCIQHWSMFSPIMECIIAKLPMTAAIIPRHPEIKSVLLACIDAVLAWTPPQDCNLMIARVKALQAITPIIQHFPDRVVQVFTVLFESMNTPLSFAQSSSTADVAQQGEHATYLSIKSSSIIANICQECAVLLNKWGLTTILVQQLSLAANTASLYANARMGMREALISLSEACDSPGSRLQLAMLAVNDIIVDWNAVVADCAQSPAEIFSSSELLLQAISNYNSANKQLSGVGRAKNVLQNLVCISRRVDSPMLLDTVWTMHPHTKKYHKLSPEKYDELFPVFSPVWTALFPMMLQATKTLHGVWHPTLRQTLSAGEAVNIYFPPMLDVRKDAGEDTSGWTDRCVSPIMLSIRRKLDELRGFLYQLLGQAAVHKAVYVNEEFHKALLQQLSDAVVHMENTHLIMLFKNFLELYVLNALPSEYGIVAKFMGNFISVVLQRLSTAWSEVCNNPTSAEAVYYYDIYKGCSIPTGVRYAELGDDAIQTARETVIAALTRQFGDTMGAIACCRGFLVNVNTRGSDETAAAGGHNNNNKHDKYKKGKNRQQQQKQKQQAARDRDQKTTTGVGGKGDDEKMQVQKCHRRQALQGMLLDSSFACLTKPFVSAAIALICLPECIACRRGIMLATFLTEQCASDDRLVVAVAKECFSAALLVLLKEEAWSAGLEMELVDFLQVVYCHLVLGQSLDGSSSAVSTRVAPKQSRGGGDRGGGGGRGRDGRGVVWKGARQQGQAQRQERAGFVSDLPRLVMCEVPGVEMTDIIALEKALTEPAAQQSKGKRKDLFKDFIAQVLAKNKPEGAAAGSVFARQVPAILDIRTRMERESQNRSKAVGGVKGVEAVAYDLFSFFDDDL